MCNQGALIMSKSINQAQESGLHIDFSADKVTFYRFGKEVVTVKLQKTLNDLSDDEELSKSVDYFLKTGIFDYKGITIL